MLCDSFPPSACRHRKRHRRHRRRHRGAFRLCRRLLPHHRQSRFWSVSQYFYYKENRNPRLSPHLAAVLLFQSVQNRTFLRFDLWLSLLSLCVY